MPNLTLQELHSELDNSYSLKEEKLSKAFSIFMERKGEDSNLLSVNEEHIYFEKGDEAYRMSYVLEEQKVSFGEEENIEVVLNESIEDKDSLTELLVEALAEGDNSKADEVWAKIANVDVLLEGIKKAIRGGKLVKLDTKDLKRKKKGFVVKKGGAKRKQTAIEKAVKKAVGKALGKSAIAKKSRKKSMKLRKKLQLSHQEFDDNSDMQEEIAFKKQQASVKKKRKVKMAKLNKKKKGKKGFKRVSTKSGGVKLVKLSAKEKATKKKIGAKLGKAKLKRESQEVNLSVIDLNEEVRNKAIEEKGVITPEIICENLLQSYDDGIQCLNENKDIIVAYAEDNTESLDELLTIEEGIAILTPDEIEIEVSGILAEEGILEDDKITMVTEAIYTGARVQYRNQLDELVSSLAKHSGSVDIIEEAARIIEENKYGESVDDVIENFICENVDDVAQLQMALEVVDDIIEALEEEDEADDLDKSFKDAKSDLEKALESEEGMDEDRFEEIKDLIDEILDASDDEEDDEEDEMNEESKDWKECSNCGVMNPSFEKTCVECGK